MSQSERDHLILTRVLRAVFFSSSSSVLVVCRLHAQTFAKTDKVIYKYGDHKLKTTSVGRVCFNECGLRCCVVQVNSCEKLQTHVRVHKHSHE